MQAKVFDVGSDTFGNPFIQKSAFLPNKKSPRILCLALPLCLGMILVYKVVSKLKLQKKCAPKPFFDEKPKDSDDF